MTSPEDPVVQTADSVEREAPLTPAVGQNDIFQIVKMLHLQQEEERERNRRRTRQLMWIVGGSVGAFLLLLFVVVLAYTGGVRRERDRLHARAEALERIVIRAAVRDSKLLRELEALNADPSGVAAAAASAAPASAGATPAPLPKSDPNRVVTLAMPAAPRVPNSFRGYATRDLLLITDKKVSIPWRVVIPEQ